MNDDVPILIAEDDDDDFFFFRRAVRATHIENPVLRFRDGSEFIKFAEGLGEKHSVEPWLLFVDISMPLMNGFEVLKWIKERQSRLNVRPIVLSGSSREEDISKARELGAAEYLVKPLVVADLARLAANYMKPVAA